MSSAPLSLSLSRISPVSSPWCPQRDASECRRGGEGFTVGRTQRRERAQAMRGVAHEQTTVVRGHVAQRLPINRLPPPAFPFLSHMCSLTFYLKSSSSVSPADFRRLPSDTSWKRWAAMKMQRGAWTYQPDCEQAIGAAAEEYAVRMQPSEFAACHPAQPLVPWQAAGGATQGCGVSVSSWAVVERTELEQEHSNSMCVCV